MTQSLRRTVARMRLCARDEGQGLAEYGLILVLVAAVCAAALTSLQAGIADAIESPLSVF